MESFIEIKNKIDISLTGLKYGIEHVGSTSVAGLDSKNIIDIDIIYENEAEFEKIKAGLIEIGYYHKGNQGIEQREVFKRTGNIFDPILDKVSHHLYVCPLECKALERHLLSRGFLRKHDWARLAYQEMKYELAEKAGQNKKRYAELKELNVNDFIDSIIEKERIALYKNLEQPITQT